MHRHPPAPTVSLLQLSLGHRLAVVAPAILAVWLAVLWALA